MLPDKTSPATMKKKSTFVQGISFSFECPVQNCDGRIIFNNLVGGESGYSIAVCSKCKSKIMILRGSPLWDALQNAVEKNMQGSLWTLERD